MIRGYMTAHGGLAYVEGPTRRQKVRQRRLTAVASIGAMASAAALLGAMAPAERPPPEAPPAPSAFSYFTF